MKGARVDNKPTLAANKKAAPKMGLPEAAYAELSPRWSRYLARRLKGQGAGQALLAPDFCASAKIILSSRGVTTTWRPASVISLTEAGNPFKAPIDAMPKAVVPLV